MWCSQWPPIVTIRTLQPQFPLLILDNFKSYNLYSGHHNPSPVLVAYSFQISKYTFQKSSLKHIRSFRQQRLATYSNVFGGLGSITADYHLLNPMLHHSNQYTFPWVQPKRWYPGRAPGRSRLRGPRSWIWGPGVITCVHLWSRTQLNIITSSKVYYCTIVPSTSELCHPSLRTVRIWGNVNGSLIRPIGYKPL